MRNKYNLPCNIASTLNLIGDRWTLLIIHEILIGNTTFNEMKQALPGISAKILSDRLKRLEEDKIIFYEIYSHHPLRRQYLPAKKGKELAPIFNAFVIWGQDNLENCFKRLVDSKTGEDVEIGYFLKSTGERISEVEAVFLNKEHSSSKLAQRKTPR